jgi:oxidase EvaA
VRAGALERDLAALRGGFLDDRARDANRFPPVAVSPAVEFDLLVSRTAAHALHDDYRVAEWLKAAREGASLQTEIIPLERVAGWRIEEGSGNLVHDSGRFFTVLGLDVRHRKAFDEVVWDQPIIEQPEIGILGILAAKIGGVLHFCLQAKEEPGNIGSVQLSPTVQATYSNYTKAHGGSAPPFVELFLKPPPERLLFGRLQTEDGGRFLFKSNRNMIVEAEAPPAGKMPEGYIWLTLRQVARLMALPDTINACARSILSSVVFPGSFDPGPALRFLEKSRARRGGAAILDAEAAGSVAGWLEGEGREEMSLASTLQWINNLRAINHIVARRGNLNELQEWQLDSKGFYSHVEGRFFRIVGLSVSSGHREVSRWCQPIIENQTKGIIGLLVRETPAGREILMQTKSDVGNRPTVQLGPTVQVTPGNYHGSRKLAKPFLLDEFSGPHPWPVLRESMQAEEGARFYREDHRHRIMLLPAGQELALPDEYRWLPVSHARLLVQIGEQVNSCARSALACLL